MNPNPPLAPVPDEFEALRKILALKRHEVPPPRFLNELPGRVMARIEDVESHAARAWWQGLMDRLVARPVFAGLGGLLAGALVAGLFLPAQGTPQGAVDLAGGTVGLGIVRETFVPARAATSHRATETRFVTYDDASSVAPVMERPSPFSRRLGVQYGGAQPVSFTPGQ